MNGTLKVAPQLYGPQKAPYGAQGSIGEARGEAFDGEGAAVAVGLGGTEGATDAGEGSPCDGGATLGSVAHEASASDAARMAPTRRLDGEWSMRRLFLSATGAQRTANDSSRIVPSEPVSPRRSPLAPVDVHPELPVR